GDDDSRVYGAGRRQAESLQRSPDRGSLREHAAHTGGPHHDRSHHLRARRATILLLMLDLAAIDTHWTLFLDRDGVINHEKEDGYILHYGEFVFYEGAKEAIRLFATTFGLVVIVTNQRGIGKQLMTAADLQDIHDKMSGEIVKAGGRVDDIYYCDSL